MKNETGEEFSTRLTTGWRVCIDYRRLNEVTRKYHFSLPFIDQLLERVSEHPFYCFLDGYSGYFQIEIALEDQEKTTFTCPFGTYAYRRMPFGLCNAPATFQRCMLSMFSDMVERIMEVYMVILLYMEAILKNVKTMYCISSGLFKKGSSVVDAYAVDTDITGGHGMAIAGPDHPKTGPYRASKGAIYNVVVAVANTGSNDTDADEVADEDRSEDAPLNPDVRSENGECTKICSVSVSFRQFVGRVLPPASSVPGTCIVPVFKLPKPWVHDLDMQSLLPPSPTSETMCQISNGAESGPPEPFEGYGSLSWGPGGKATMTVDTSGVHTELKPSSGSLDGYDPGSPGPVVGRETSSTGANPFPDQLFIFYFFPFDASFDDAVSFLANVAGTARSAFAISAGEGPPNANTNVGSAVAFAAVYLGSASPSSILFGSELGGHDHHGSIHLVPSVRVIHAVGGGNFHAVGGGSDSGNRDHGEEDNRFSLGFAPRGLVQFRSGCFRHQMEHVAVGVGAESYFGSSIFSPSAGVPATSAVRFWFFQLWCWFGLIFRSK